MVNSNVAAGRVGTPGAPWRTIVLTKEIPLCQVLGTELLFFVCMNEWMDDCVWMDACMDEWMNERKNEWMNEWMNGLGWMDE